MLTMLRNAVFIWLMVSYEVACAVPLQLAPAMFWLEAHILRASSSTVWACTSKRPAIDRISCGAVIKRVGISLSLVRNDSHGCEGMGARQGHPRLYPPAGERGTTLGAGIFEAMLPMPRAPIAPINAWVNGLLARPGEDSEGAATLVP